MFKLEIETDNAAFEDIPNEEIARILEDTARKLRAHDRTEKGPCRDYNGNLVGSWEYKP